MSFQNLGARDLQDGEILRCRMMAEGVAFGGYAPVGKVRCARRRCSRRATAVYASTTIALTREAGKNKKLSEAAQSLGDLRTVELPCVATVERAAGIAQLTEELRGGEAAWVVVSSPESARIIVDAWVAGGRPPIRGVAAIGGGTTSALGELREAVRFEPSRATFATLAAELPYAEGDVVLYPASAKASADNVTGLVGRGFEVRRVDTYTTQTATWDDGQCKLVEGVDIATFASPTTVRGWVANAGHDEELRVACIGETSAMAARKAGFRHIFYPHKPGIAGWVDAIRRASAARVEAK